MSGVLWEGKVPDMQRRWWVLARRFQHCPVASSMHGRLTREVLTIVFLLSQCIKPNVMHTIHSHFLRNKNSNGKKKKHTKMKFSFAP